MASCPTGSALKDQETCDYECFYTTENKVRTCNDSCKDSQYYDPETRECFTSGCDKALYYIN